MIARLLFACIMAGIYWCNGFKIQNSVKQAYDKSPVDTAEDFGDSGSLLGRYERNLHEYKELGLSKSVFSKRDAGIYVLKRTRVYIPYFLIMNIPIALYIYLL